MICLDDASREVAEFIDACNWQSWIRLQRDGVLAVPQREPIDRPDLAGNVDLLGFSYYSALAVHSAKVDGAPPDRRAALAARLRASTPTACVWCSIDCTPSSPARRS